MTTHLIRLTALALALIVVAPAASAQQTCADLGLSVTGALSTGGALGLSLQNAPAGALVVFEAAVTAIDFTSGAQALLPPTLGPVCYGFVTPAGTVGCTLTFPPVPPSAGIASVDVTARATIYDILSLTPPITFTVCHSDVETATIPF